MRREREREIEMQNMYIDGTEKAHKMLIGKPRRKESHRIFL
jgi:hypothetical protein